jgi:hypothetical protein
MVWMIHPLRFAVCSLSQSSIGVQIRSGIRFKSQRLGSVVIAQ